MNTHIVSRVRISGISSAVPEQVWGLTEAGNLFGMAEAHKISESTGVRNRHIAPPGMCTSDLCHAAAERLLSDLNWDRDSIDCMIFVSQTPDYRLPATSCCLHGRLKLSKHCAAFDISLGCSGYIYGLWVAATLAATGRRILLLVGDIASAQVSPQDRSVATLFGDAGSATALEYDAGAPDIVFTLGTDGTGYRHLIIPAGGFRQPRTESTSRRTPRENGNSRSDEDVFMDGAEVFAFTLREVPPMVKHILAAAGWSIDSADAFVMHQANRFILNHLAKKMKVPPEKMVVALEDFGNTSSASVPLAINHSLHSDLKSRPMKLVLAGFGVGLSWGAVAVTVGPLACPEVIFLNAVQTPPEVMAC